jgi:hypothetical protein
MVPVEHAVKHINNKANDKRTTTSWNSRGDEVEYDSRTYYKSFTYLSDRSQIYTYIESYLKIHDIPHTIQIRYDDCYVFDKKQKKQVREKKLLFTINIV